jgi:hypothetical protein
MGQDGINAHRQQRLALHIATVHGSAYYLLQAGPGGGAGGCKLSDSTSRPK